MATSSKKHGRRRGILARVQRALEGLYRVEPQADVRDYVISDAERRALGVMRTPGEQLLLAQDPTEHTLDVGLFVDEAALAELRDPLPDARLGDYLLAVEGVSHFLYVMVRASAERRFSALELELQAEVDKYLLVLLGTWRLAGEPARGLRQRLFHRVRFHADLSIEERDRYATANAAADEYTARLEQRYVKRRRIDDLLCEVRRFYRMDCAGKLGHIARKAA